MPTTKIDIGQYQITKATIEAVLDGRLTADDAAKKLAPAQPCVLCGKEVVGYGNNPEPCAFTGRACDDCNATKVIMARLKEAGHVGVDNHVIVRTWTNGLVQKCYELEDGTVYAVSHTEDLLQIITGATRADRIKRNGKA